MERGLNRFLRKRGATSEEIDAAQREGMLTLLAVDRLLVPGEQYLDSAQVAERSEVPRETATKLWRALGFPDVPDGEPAFSDESVEVLRLLHASSNSSIFSDASADSLVTQVRAVGTGLARVAESMSDQIAEAIVAMRAEGLDDETVAATVADTLDWELLARLNDYGLRVLLRAAIWRKLLTPQTSSGEMPSLAVGFVDLVGYTAISQELDSAELAALVERFESVAYDTVARLGARLVKTIGDEVMFVTEDPVIALRVAMALTERTGSEELLPRARAGLAFGPALAREGDYYGAVVNLAHRLVEIARPASAVVSSEFAAVVVDRDFTFHRLRARKIRGIGKVDIYAARSAGETSSAPAEVAATR